MKPYFKKLLYTIYQDPLSFHALRQKYIQTAKNRILQCLGEKKLKSNNLPMGMSVVFLEDEAVDDRTHHFLTNAIVNYAADIRHLYCENSWHTITTNRFEKRKKGNGYFGIIVEKDEVVSILHAVKSERKTNSVFIERVATNQNYRGRGLAGMLLKEFSKFIKEQWGVIYITSAVDKENTPSIKMHKNAGRYPTCEFTDGSDQTSVIEFGKFI